jgi:hypothetical protein
MDWFKITVSDEEVARDGMGKVMDAFERILPLDDDRAKRCALFHRDDAEASLIFVSPELAKCAPELVETFSGVPCEAPPPRRKGEEFGTALLLASHDKSAWALLESSNYQTKNPG